jgi:hypothetical protein
LNFSPFSCSSEIRSPGRALLKLIFWLKEYSRKLWPWHFHPDLVSQTFFPDDEKSFMIADSRKRIETTFSQISSMFPKLIHAVTTDGFLMKVILFIFVFTINENDENMSV